MWQETFYIPDEKGEALKVDQSAWSQHFGGQDIDPILSEIPAGDEYVAIIQLRSRIWPELSPDKPYQVGSIRKGCKKPDDRSWYATLDEAIQGQAELAAQIIEVTARFKAEDDALALKRA